MIDSLRRNNLYRIILDVRDEVSTSMIKSNQTLKIDADALLHVTRGHG
jgi:hypothetical protein